MGGLSPLPVSQGLRGAQLCLKPQSPFALTALAGCALLQA